MALDQSKRVGFVVDTRGHCDTSVEFYNVVGETGSFHCLSLC